MFINQLLFDIVEHRFILLDSFVYCFGIFAVRVLPSAQRERKDETQGINVDRLRWSQMGHAIEHFRCEPSIGAELTEVLRVFAASHTSRVVGHVSLNEAAAPEIGQFHHQLLIRIGYAIKNIAWLQIPVDNFVVVQMLHSLDDLTQNDISQLIRYQSNGILVDDDEIVQRPMAQLGHDKTVE